MTTQWVKKTTRNKNPPRDRAQSSTETCHVHHVRSLHSKPGAGKNCAITAHLLTTLSLQLHQHTPVKKESKNNRKAKPRMKTEHEGNAQVLFGWVKCLKWLQLSRRISKGGCSNKHLLLCAPKGNKTDRARRRSNQWELHGSSWRVQRGTKKSATVIYWVKITTQNLIKDQSTPARKGEVTPRSSLFQYKTGVLRALLTAVEVPRSNKQHLSPFS